jgi:hypothetical protein
MWGIMIGIRFLMELVVVVGIDIINMERNLSFYITVTNEKCPRPERRRCVMLSLISSVCFPLLKMPL